MIALGAVNIGLGELVASVDPGVTLGALGLGSCIAVVVYDGRARVGGLAHVVLPIVPPGHGVMVPGRFAPLAVPELVRRAEELGASRKRLRAWLVGGAHVLPAAALAVGDIGERNARACRDALRSLRVAVAGEAVGGAKGRSVRLAVADGTVAWRTIGEDWRPL